MAGRKAVLGIFPYLDDLLGAIQNLQTLGHRAPTVFSPVPRHEVLEALGVRPSPVRYFTLCGGLLGAIGGVSLASYAHLQWSFITSGKPVLAWIPFVVIGFEFTILLGVLFTIAGLLINARLPRIRVPDAYDPRFSLDRFGILVSCREEEKESVSKLLREAGAEELREVE